MLWEFKKKLIGKVWCFAPCGCSSLVQEPLMAGGWSVSDHPEHSVARRSPRSVHQCSQGGETEARAVRGPWRGSSCLQPRVSCVMWPVSLLSPDEGDKATWNQISVSGPVPTPGTRQGGEHLDMSLGGLQRLLSQCCALQACAVRKQGHVGTCHLPDCWISQGCRAGQEVRGGAMWRLASRAGWEPACSVVPYGFAALCRSGGRYPGRASGHRSQASV